MTTTWQPMSEQPPEGTTYRGLTAGGCHLWEKSGHAWSATPPHRVGERVAVMEEWAVSETYDAISDDRCAEWLPGCSVAYKADDPTTLIAWRPAWAMPDWAIRTYRTYTSSIPKRACDVTEEQCEAMGFASVHVGGTYHTTARDAFEASLSCDAWSLWGWLETFVDEAAK